ncbi:Predicted nuclease (RNAse H fold) [Roseibium denhamense]|uniref:Predicted nuclease (RNAse H fold) n=1 Tax=Roseibium denhamense TaxID=76305 RepID=A0ABY1PA25_9HYPH|nr:Predicted nuclease (RNAse H fold) [Roseibium denhamense]
MAGVDGCKAGWIAVLRNLNDPAGITLKLFPRFSDLLSHIPILKIIAVDMPIGLPDLLGPDGRGAEKAARKHLGMRQSSVFSVPSRASVYEVDYWAACETSLKSSEPPRKVSKQCFYLFPKIREIDGLMSPSLEDRIYEVHPELAFWRLNGEREIDLPKKVKGRANPDGLDQRRDLLLTKGLPRELLDQKPPKGCGRDDLLDAAANSLIAERIHFGNATPFPQDYQRDGKGLRMAIWA